ncbi:MAG: hypothetical protein IKU01_09260 [Bacteroidales bacterium]|nr:hypothetical protein [Bacteroidales bacterium]
MAKHILAIDETGRFSMGNDESFACGVVVTKDESEVKKAYQKTYSDFGFPEPVPDDIKGLLTDDTIENGDKARYHFNKLDDTQKAFCKYNLMPLVDEIIKSEGKPALFSNNQNWWLIAVTAVVRCFLKSRDLKDNDEVNVFIDGRKDTVWGMVYEEGNQLDDLSDNDRRDRYNRYHNNIKQQIENNVKAYVPKTVKFKIEFRSDTSNVYVNLADIACGFVRSDKRNITQKITSVSCKSFMDGNDPVLVAKDNSTAALSLIFQEVFNNNLRNVHLVAELLKPIRKENDNYVFVWDMFYDFLKSKIDERASESSLVKIKEFVDLFLNEFKNVAHNYLPTNKYLDNLVLFVEYSSHSGEIEMPFCRESFLNCLRKTDSNSETRLLRKWEKMVSFTLREAQVYFNAYNFSEINEHVENIWVQHEKLLGSISDIICDDKKDEPTTALIGTLAQSYAYKGDFDNAIDYFNMSLEYSVKSKNRTYSFLFTIYHRNKDLENARRYFELQNSATPEQYYANKKYGDTWKLLSYCKLRALELYVNGNTELPHIELSELSSYNCEYPFPLVMKWTAIALYLEDKVKNKAAIEKLLNDAIANLLEKDNGFAINTLALPLIQCYALLNKQNPYHARYNNLLSEFEKKSVYFAKYVESMPDLKDLNNSQDIWDRAMLLPFIYA